MAINDSVSWANALKPIYKKLETIWYPDAITPGRLKKDTTFEGVGRYVPVFTEGGIASHSFPDAKANKSVISNQNFVLDVSELYSIGSVNNLAIIKSKSDKGSVGRLLKQALDTAAYAFARMIAAAWWGNGGGAIGQVGALSVGNTVITLKDINDVVWFEKRMILQGSATDGTSGSLLPGSAIIIGVDRDLGKITFSSDVTALITGLTTDTYLFPIGNFGHGVVGLPAWCPATTVLAATTFKGVDRTQDLTRLAGSRFDADGSTIEDALINAVARHRRNGGRAKECVLGSMRFAEFQRNAISRGYTVTAKKNESIDLTYKGYELPTASGSIVVHEDPDCPDEFGWLWDPNDWTLFSADTCPHFDKQGSEKLLVETGADAKEFRLKGYFNFECRKTVNNACITWD